MNSNHIGRALAVTAALSTLAGAALADVVPSPIFSSHMVLQRGITVPIWGTATAGETVTVNFRDQTHETIADADGKWMIDLDPLTVGEPATLTVADPKSCVKLDDVLVGEVWVGSGQSNMARSVSAFAKEDESLTKLADSGPFPKLRVIRFEPEKGNTWQVCEGKACLQFSSLMFAFGQPLQQKLDVPVGLILSAVSGTPSGRWVRPQNAR